MAEVAPVGAGEAPRPVSPAGDGHLRVRGGVGGIAFQYEELLYGARAMDAAADDLFEAERIASTVREQLKHYQEGERESHYHAWTAVSESVEVLSGVRGRLQRIASDVRASHRDYESAEALADISLRAGLAFPALAGRFPPFSSFASDQARHADQTGTRSIVEQGISRAPGALAMFLLPGLGPFAGLMGSMGGPTDARAVVARLSTVPGLEFLKPRPIEATAVSSEEQEIDLRLPAILYELEKTASVPGQVEVVRVERPEGPVFLLLIPGTQTEHGTGGENPFDAAGIVDGLGYDSRETSRAIRQALREAGAEAGARVVAAGHSQGGIHAMNLSQDKAFLAEFDLKCVVTAGSPVGAMTPGQGIDVLHLEHADDPVPALEGRRNPDTGSRVTVTLTDPPVLSPGEEPGPATAHKLTVYAEGAERVATSTDPSLAASMGTLAGCLVRAGRQL